MRLIARDRRGSRRVIVVGVLLASIATGFAVSSAATGDSSAGAASDDVSFGVLQRDPTAADVLPANVSQTVAKSDDKIVPSTARLVTTGEYGFSMYVATAADHDVCRITIDDYGYGWGCSSPADFQRARNPVGTEVVAGGTRVYGVLADGATDGVLTSASGASTPIAINDGGFSVVVKEMPERMSWADHTGSAREVQVPGN